MHSINLILIITSFLILVSSTIILFFAYRRIKTGEKELKENEERFRNIFTQSPVGIEIYDKEGNLILINEKCLEIYGIESKNDILNFNLFKDTELPKDFNEKISNENFYKSEIDIDFDIIKKENLFRTKKSGRYYLDLLITALKTDNEISGYLVQVYDVTENKKATKKVQEYTKQLEEINISKDKFFSIIAHDLKSPFTGLIGLSQILSDDYENLSETDKRKFINHIQRTTKSLYSLIENLLQWSRLQSGKIQFQPVKIDLYEAIFRVIELYSINAIAKNIKVINKINPDTFVFADQNMLHSVLQNIFSNAIKYTDAGGQIIIFSIISDDFMTICISDTGTGISKENLEKLFKIDTHFSTEGTSGEKGTGLGLILCKEFIEKNGGKLSLETEIKKGTTMKFSVPKPKK